MVLRMKDYCLDDTSVFGKWKLNDADMSSKFFTYQKTSYQYCLKNDGKLKMSKDIDELLSLSGILLLQDNKKSSDTMGDCFSAGDLQSMFENFKGQFDHVDVDAQTVIKLMQCIKNIEDKEEEEVDAIFLGLRKESSSKPVKKAIGAIKSL